MTSKLLLLIGKLSEGDCVGLCRQFCKAPLSPIHPKHCHHHFYLQHQYSLNTSSSLSSSPLSSTPLSPSSAMSSTHPKHYLRLAHCQHQCQVIITSHTLSWSLSSSLSLQVTLLCTLILYFSHSYTSSPPCCNLNHYC